MIAASASPIPSNSAEKNGVRSLALVVGWMAFTFLAGAFIMGFVLDGILRNALDDHARELLAFLRK